MAATTRPQWYFGYRLKVPLALTAVALLSGVLVALTTYALVDNYVEDNAQAEARRLAATLSRALLQPVLRNDVWQAYQTVQAATWQPSQEAGEPMQVVVLDARGQVFVSPSPRVFPLGLHLSGLPADMAQAAHSVFNASPAAASPVREVRQGTLVAAQPILDQEESLLGVVVVYFPSSLTAIQRRAVVGQLVALGALAMLAVAVLGGVVGLRMTSPLERLRMAMQAAPQRDVRADVAEITQRADEVGQLARAFSSMMGEIAAKRELERHMLQAERMASIGQLTASIAHEVNNPLGGMLAAIENRRLRGPLDEASTRTLALLERGLHHIHDTVQALLNEARSETHVLTASDLHDLEVLLRPEAEHARCRLDWAVAVPAHLALPAVPVRQVVLNLALNAIAAAGAQGRVRVWTRDVPQGWQVLVGNSGNALNAAQLSELVHGRERSAEGRLGLGLWITARILHTLGGGLRLETDPTFATTLVAQFVPAAEAMSPTQTDEKTA